MPVEFSKRDTFWLRRLRTLTVGFLTPSYFIRAGTLVSLRALWSGPAVFVPLLSGKVLKVLSKIFGIYPILGRFRSDRQER